jgi:N-acetylglucosamine-6-phosphate deacetylase
MVASQAASDYSAKAGSLNTSTELDALKSPAASFRPPMPQMLGVLATLMLLPGVGMPEIAAQSSRGVQPVAGLRENLPSDLLFRGATLVDGPDFYQESASPSSTGDVLIRDGSIVGVAPSIEPPPGCKVVDCTGKTLYAGWINAWHTASNDEVTPAQSHDDYWNANITPGRRIRELSAVPDAEKLRRQGFTTTVLAPPGRIIGGQPSVWSLNESKDSSSGPQRIVELPWMTATMTVPQPNDAGESYPNSPMGAIALLRQTLYDARWYGEAMAAYQANTSLPRPLASSTLQRLNHALTSSSFVFDSPNERMVLRADKIAHEFSLQAIVRGSGREYRDADTIAAKGHALLLPLNFPSEPNVATPAEAREVELVELMHWKLAPTNPAEMIARGASVCLTTDRMDDVSKFLDQLRTAIKHGLSRRDAIASLTTTPARVLGIDKNHGRIATGMIANLILADGDLLDKDTKVLSVFVGGQKFEINSEPDDELEMLTGPWELELPKQSSVIMKLVLTQTDGRVSAKLQATEKSSEEKPPAKKQKPEKQTKKQRKPADTQTKPEKTPADKPITIELKKLVQRTDQIAGQIDCGDGNADWCVAMGLPAGTHAIVVRTSAKSLSEVSAEQPLSIEIVPVGQTSLRFDTTRVDTQTESEATDDEPEPESTAKKPTRKLAVVTPLGAYGRSEPVAQPGRVLFRGALVWTCEDRTDLEIPQTPMDVLVENGRITAIEERIQLSDDENCLIIDARGKHITPGLIDCHSHVATDGGINESGQVVTAEVRISDFIDHTDITLYRQLAGGVTAANVLHGSANPIGGQNQVIKFRWGDPMDDLRFDDAPAGIKFALGENVKRSSSRYPNTRMGVEQLLRDQLLAGREYATAHRRWNSGERDRLPPRVDLQLQAIAEIQDGTRWIHCHSYRQDEILATLDVLDEFGIRIGSLQHILEGYKVADRMARHGAMASSFADWWAYKFEVYDAIPFNGVLMHKAGIVVSYNSDDPELGRHLNTEAAKAVKYGGVSPTEALKFVTLNPAKQLRIEHRVGSIEVGKDADLVVWSGPPLSTTSRCEQTWIDGRSMFSLETDAALRERDQTWRNELIQELLDGKPKDEMKDKSASETDDKPIDEEDRWLRYDEFCNTRGAQQAALDANRSGESR